MKKTKKPRVDEGKTISAPVSLRIRVDGQRNFAFSEKSFSPRLLGKTLNLQPAVNRQPGYRRGDREESMEKNILK